MHHAKCLAAMVQALLSKSACQQENFRHRHIHITSNDSQTPEEWDQSYIGHLLCIRSTTAESPITMSSSPSSYRRSRMNLVRSLASKKTVSISARHSTLDRKTRMI